MENVELTVDSLCVGQGSFRVTSISFSMRNGDIIGIVGRSGSGKSTFIKTFVGLKKPISGKIRYTVNGKEVPVSGAIGFSPQDNSLFPFLTVEENLTIFGKLHGMSKDSIRRNTEELLSWLDMENCRGKKIIHLSGGMQKRADLAVSLIHDPKIIVLDEPFNGLDISLQQFIWRQIRLLSEQGKIVIISSHMLSDIQKNCNMLGLIEKGMYYGTASLAYALRRSQNSSLEAFLEQVFSKDLEEDKAKKR